MAGERSGAFRAKVSKDIQQSASLIEFFRDSDPEAIQSAWTDAVSRGPGWKKRALEGRRLLASADATLAQALTE